MAESVKITKNMMILMYQMEVTKDDFGKNQYHFPREGDHLLMEEIINLLNGEYSLESWRNDLLENWKDKKAILKNEHDMEWVQALKDK